MTNKRIITILLMMISIGIIANPTPMTLTQCGIVASAIVMFLNEIKLIKL
jgi:hypothetical protein